MDDETKKAVADALKAIFEENLLSFGDDDWEASAEQLETELEEAGVFLT